MSDDRFERPRPLGYREQTVADLLREAARAEEEDREALRQAKVAEARRARDRARGYTDDETDVPALAAAAHELIVPSLRWFEDEYAELAFVNLRLAKLEAKVGMFLPNPNAHWSVYVVLLSRLSLEEQRGYWRGRPNMPCVYVGQTWHTPEYRFEQHKGRVEGHASRYVRAWGLALLPEVYAPYNPLTQERALEVEDSLADSLHQLGCTVFGGH